MMLSDAEFFTSLAEKLISLGFLSNNELDSCLEELGGIQMVISEGYYIVACEYIAREIPMNKSSQEVLIFLKENKEFIMQHEDFMYYFVEALLDRMFAMGNEVLPIIAAAPESYQQFLRRRFLGE
ncbi:hypothetical protein [Rhizobium hidalgonense]|uniref:hypothetical protein n=1 Tax=Rhizobium hidalgonense TaxID=1538159 RepID=UPI001105E413|nr:hypothetical protein [Rhizobium hidalgonense]QKK27448.1 hypothetical protein FFM81_029370 [Rhizobium hidalgonense]